jgi:hypothetical protein
MYKRYHFIELKNRLLEKRNKILDIRFGKFI